MGLHLVTAPCLTNSSSPVLYRMFQILTPRSELPALPPSVPGYRGIHAYTILQVAVTAGIFAVTTTKGAPVFPVLIIILVPIRLLLMNRCWQRETLLFVDAWACREGAPEDEEDDDADIQTNGPSTDHIDCQQRDWRPDSGDEPVTKVDHDTDVV